MRVMVTGGKGQLGTEVTRYLQERGYEVYSCGKSELDITDAAQVSQTVGEIRPDVIVHTAAYTKVDLAETEIDEAYKINAYGTRNLAVAAEEAGAKIVYISTDYVFEGNGQDPYHEFMDCHPNSIYGKSKLAGEQMVQQCSTKFFILRTSWVFGKYGNNFVKTMLKLAQNNRELNVVDDQFGSPTYTYDLAQFIEQIIQTKLYGIYHTSNTGFCTWYEFARAIFAGAGVKDMQVNPVGTKDFPRPAPRPANSRLDHMAIRLNGLPDFRHWREALADYLLKD